MIYGYKYIIRRDCKVNIEEMLNSITWASEEEKEVVIEKLTSVQDNQISTLIKYYDENAAEVLKRIGWPRVRNIIPQLLEWLQDINRPGSSVIADLLVSIGEPAIPHIKEILRGNDYTWQYWILEYIVEKWTEDLVAKLKPDLMRLSHIWDIHENGVDIAAMRILVTHDFLDPTDKLEILQEFDDKRRRYSSVLNDLNEIEKNINRIRNSAAKPSTVKELVDIFEKIYNKSLKRN